MALWRHSLRLMSVAILQPINSKSVCTAASLGLFPMEFGDPGATIQLLMCHHIPCGAPLGCIAV